LARTQAVSDKRTGIFFSGRFRCIQDGKPLPALSDPEVGILLAARGRARRLAFGQRQNPGFFAAFSQAHCRFFSDITALHFLWSQAGVPSFFGPNVTQLTVLPPEHRRRFLSLLEGRLDAAGNTSGAAGKRCRPHAACFAVRGESYRGGGSGGHCMVFAVERKNRHTGRSA
jgi:hypothetical protein